MIDIDKTFRGYLAYVKYEKDEKGENKGLDLYIFPEFIKLITHTIFNVGDYEKAREMTETVKDLAYKHVLKTTNKTFWEVEKEAITKHKRITFVKHVYDIFLLESWWNFESYMFFMEKHRPPDKRFYLPRRKTLQPVCRDLEDLANREIKFLGISLPSRTGKSTLALLFMTWIMMKRPDSHSALGGHSGLLVKGFYNEILNFTTTSEYAYEEIYHFWNPDKFLLESKSAEDMTINFNSPDRFSTITCRGIDGTWTGAVDVSWDGILYVDDLVRDREHSLSPTRMENTWQEYLNKMVDRKSGADMGGKFAGACELMIGTLWNVYDPLYRMELIYGEDPLYRFRKIPALDERDESNFNYPIGGFTTEYYREIRDKLTKADWMAKYQQSPFVREGLLYTEESLQYFDGELPEENHRTIAVLDPALGGGDYLSMVIVWIGSRNYVVDWIYDKRTKAYTIPRIVSKIIQHGVTELHYEKNGIGRVFDDEVSRKLKEKNYLRCVVKPFTAPEGMSKEDKIIGYSDWVKTDLVFVEKGLKGKTYQRSEDYERAMTNDVLIYTTEGKNPHDDAVDNLAQVGRVFEKKQNGTIDIILNPFNTSTWR